MTGHANLTVEATPGLVLPEERTTGLGCIPEGKTVSYQCTVVGSLSPPGSTVWLGSAFNCFDSSDLIVLHHFMYNTQTGARGSCGDLTAMSVGVNGTEYTSRLTLTATTELNGRMVNCTLNGVELIGSDTIKVQGINALVRCRAHNSQTMFRRYLWDLEAKGPAVVSQAQQGYYKSLRLLNPIDTD